jgi:uncharacterized protein (TIGR02231 family)
MTEELISIVVDNTPTPNATEEKPKHNVNVKDCPVRAVKVYNSLAEVTRMLKIQLVPGEQEIILEKIPRTIQRDSVRVSGVGDSDATVLEVVYRDRKEDVTHDQTRRHELDDLIEKAQVELKELNASAARLQAETDFVQHYADSIVDVNSKQSKQVSELTQKDTLENVTKFMEYFKKQLSRVDDDNYKVQNLIKDKEEEIANLRKELQQQKPEKTSETFREVVILVQATEAGEAVFLVTYIVDNASWRASYDIRVNSIDNSISLTYYGVIKQNTREHWRNAMVSLSTATPNNRSDPPELPGLSLGYNVESYGVEKSKKSAALFGGLFNTNQSYSARSMTSSYAAVEQGSTSTTFTIPKESTIASDNQDHKVTIGIINLQCDFSYFAVPKKDVNAYLKVKAVNESPYAFLQGPMNVFFDNNFVTTTSMSAVNPGEEFESFLGRDPAVKVVYDPPSKFRETKGFLRGYHKSTVKRKIVLKNNKSVPIKVAVTDQFPMTDNGNITIETTVPKIKQDETLENSPILSGEKQETGKKTAKLVFTSENNLEWSFNMQPAETVAIPIEYSVEWPASYNINEL